MKSVYIHIPFCLKKCPYCDFYSMGMGSKRIPEQEFVQALKREMTQWLRCVNFAGAAPLETVFLGGGTPSIFSPQAIAEILASLEENFGIHPEAEITLEMNPRTANREKLQGYYRAGINRISLGVQSLETKTLEVLDRAHDEKDALQSLTDVLEMDFPQVSIDLMYGLPHQSQKGLEKTLEQLASYPLTHLSAYELILEEHTPFYERYRYEKNPLPCTEKVLRMRQSIEAFAKALGMEPYEISNWAKGGEESRHNLVYWNYGKFLGMGPSAVSFLPWNQCLEPLQSLWEGESEPHGLRLSNVRNLKEYQRERLLVDGLSTEWVSKKTAQMEWIMMGLRKTRGICREDFFQEFGEVWSEFFEKAFEKAQGKSWLEQDKEQFYLTPQGVQFSNDVIQLFMD